MWPRLPLLTEAQVSGLPPGRHFAGRDLWLRLEPDGSARWETSLSLHGVPQTVIIGNHPDVSLRQARKQAAVLQGLARRGIDPAAEQEGHRNEAARNLHQFYC